MGLREGFCTVSASIKRLRTRADRKREALESELRQFVLDLGDVGELDSDTVGRVVAAVDGRAADREDDWGFVLMGPKENAFVVEWLGANSKRPLVALRLWARLFTAIRWDTGEIMLTRDDLAEAVGVAPRHVSSIMTELEGIGAITRLRRGGRVRYFLSPRIGTKLPAAKRVDAQAEAPRLALVPEPA